MLNFTLIVFVVKAYYLYRWVNKIFFFSSLFYAQQKVISSSEKHGSQFIHGTKRSSRHTKQTTTVHQFMTAKSESGDHTIRQDEIQDKCKIRSVRVLFLFPRDQRRKYTSEKKRNAAKSNVLAIPVSLNIILNGMLNIVVVN